MSEPQLRISIAKEPLARLRSELAQLEGFSDKNSDGTPQQIKREEQEIKDNLDKILSELEQGGKEIAVFLDELEGSIKPHPPEEIRSLIFKHAELKLFCTIYPTDDFTFYLKSEKERIPREGVSDAIIGYLRSKGADGNGPSYDCPIRIYSLEDDREAFGRALACPCFGGRHWSFTFRKESVSSPKKELKNNDTTNEDAIGRVSIKYNYKARGVSLGKDGSEDRSVFLNGIDEICDLLYEAIFREPAPQSGGRAPESQGVVIVTGRTASAKSQIVRGLIYTYLTRRVNQSEKKKRSPHLVTFEDPIEKFYFGENVSPTESQKYGLDYTPRQKGKDAKTLDAALKDALRQTPAAVFVGETREPFEWKALIKFAGTGHLAFTTAHAGSLSEAMGKIFEATRTEKPSERSVIADRILALIHIKHQVIGERNVLIPTLWRRTPSGIKALIAEGRASLLPHNSGKGSSVGRYWFAQRLTQAAFGKQDRDIREELSRETIKQAIAWDMEGI